MNEVGTPALSMELGETDGFKAMQAAGKRGMGETRDLIAMASQVGTAVHYSHMAGVAHRDIKPENILLVRAEGDVSTLNGCVAKLCDFGAASIATVVPPAGTLPPPLMSSSTVGSSQYCAPEVLQLHAARLAVSRAGSKPPAQGSAEHTLLHCQRTIAQGRYNTYAADVWSFAVSMYVLGSRKVPFKSAVPSDYRFRAFVAATQPEIAASEVWRATLATLRAPTAKEASFTWTWPSHFSPLLVDLLSQCLRVDPAQRPDITSLLQHTWFSGASLVPWIAPMAEEKPSKPVSLPTLGPGGSSVVSGSTPGSSQPPVFAAGSGGGGGGGSVAGSEGGSSGSSAYSGTSSVLPFRQALQGSLTHSTHGSGSPSASIPRAGEVGATPAIMAPWPTPQQAAPFLPSSSVRPVAVQAACGGGKGEDLPSAAAPVRAPSEVGSVADVDLTKRHRDGAV